MTGNVSTIVEATKKQGVTRRRGEAGGEGKTNLLRRCGSRELFFAGGASSRERDAGLRKSQAKKEAVTVAEEGAEARMDGEGAARVVFLTWELKDLRLQGCGGGVGDP